MLRVASCGLQVKGKRNNGRMEEWKKDCWNNGMMENKEKLQVARYRLRITGNLDGLF
jgi:hypothetical protein